MNRPPARLFLAVAIMSAVALGAYATDHKQRTPPKPGLFIYQPALPPDDEGWLRTYEVEHLAGVPKDRILNDHAPVNWVGYHWDRAPKEVTYEDVIAVRCASEIPVLKATFKDLAIGMHEIRVYGRVDKPFDQLPTPPRPLYVELRINDGPQGEVSRYRMRCNYTNMHADIARISFHTFRKGDYHAEIAIGAGSREEILLDRIELHNRLHGVAFKSAKQGHYLVTPEQRQAVLEGFRKGEIKAHEGVALGKPDPKMWEPLGWEEKQTIFNAEWNRLASMDRQFLDKAQQGLKVPEGAVSAEDLAKYGSWKMEKDGTLRNETLGLTYTWEDYLARKPLPAPYPFPDDGDGFWFDPDKFPEMKNRAGGYLYILPHFYGARSWGLFNEFFRDGADKLQPQVRKAFYTDDKRLGFRLCVDLCRMALSWPALQAKTQNLSYIVDDRGKRFWGDQRMRMRFPQHYRGELLGVAYDYLWPFIVENQEDLTRLVGQRVPWVKSPADLFTFLDTYAIQSTVADHHRVLRTLDVPILAVAQGPNDVSKPWMDFASYPVLEYPSFHAVPFTDNLRTMYNRDGCSYIASWTVYAQGSALELFQNIARSEDYLRIGGTLRTNLLDAQEFPKIASAATLVLDAQVGGGYALPLGDASGGPVNKREPGGSMTAECARYGWEMTRDPRFAWFLANRFKDERPEIVEAARGQRAPWLNQSSRARHGLGFAALDSGRASDDYRAKRTAILRVGTGAGHAHSDQLDLQYFSHGMRAATDLACRSEGSTLRSKPRSWQPMVHNLVVVDDLRKQHWLGATANGDAWLEAMKPHEGAQYMAGAAALSVPADTVKTYRRQVALIDLGEGDPNAQPAVEPASYVFDVFRVDGGALHTRCFPGPQSDAFTANCELRPVGQSSFTPAAENPLQPIPPELRSAWYLKDHREGTKFDGIAGDIFEATWRISRPETAEITLTDGTVLKVPAAEPAFLGADYSPLAPRAFTLYTLFGHAGARVMVGHVYSDHYRFSLPLLHVQSAEETAGRSDVYPGLIECFRGESEIASREMVAATPNETDALRAVAVRVKTRDGREDLCFADGRPERFRTVGDVRVAGEMAFLSRDAGGVRMAHLVRGLHLEAPGLTIKPAQAVYAGRIMAVDYKALTMRVDALLPQGALAGQQMHIFNGDHHCCFEIASVRREGNETIVHFMGDPVLMHSELQQVDQEKRVVQTQMQAPYSNMPNRRKGWTLANESGARLWKSVNHDIEWFGDERAKPGLYQVDQPVTAADFADDDGDGRACVRLYDFGPGDRFEIPTSVFVRRNAEGGFQVKADTAVEVVLAGVKSVLRVEDFVRNPVTIQP